MVTEPLRAGPVFVATVTKIVPLPVPVVDDRLTQSRLSYAVHVQIELEEATEIEPLPPLEEKLPIAGVIE